MENRLCVTRAGTVSPPRISLPLLHFSLVLLFLPLPFYPCRSLRHTYRIPVSVHQQRRAIPGFLQRRMELVERQQGLVVLVVVLRRRGRDAAVFVGLKKTGEIEEEKRRKRRRTRRNDSQKRQKYAKLVLGIVNVHVFFCPFSTVRATDLSTNHLRIQDDFFPVFIRSCIRSCVRLFTPAAP